MTMNGSPVPVPKESLFKGKLPGKPVYQAESSASAYQPEVPKPKLIHDLKPKAVKVEAQGVPLIKAKPVTPKAPYAGDGLVPVLIPYDLAQSIANKPSTGGGWQALMGEVQKVLAVNETDPGDAPGKYTHVLNLTPALLNKLIDKATLYGPGGGYQGVMKSIVCLAVKQHPGLILKGGA